MKSFGQFNMTDNLMRNNITIDHRYYNLHNHNLLCTNKNCWPKVKVYLFDTIIDIIII